VDASTRAAQPHILSTFGGAGRGTGGLAQTAIGQAHADAFARQFDAERGRQQQAQIALPGIALTPSSILSGIGGQQQGLEQQRLSAPIGLMSAAGGQLPGNLVGQQTTQTQPLYDNPWATGLGIGMTGLGLASGLGGTLFGADAMKGGLLGLFR
jgi:hypothetical protein